MRLIDANGIEYTTCSVYWGKDEETGNDFYRRSDIAFKSDIDEIQPIDPETLPIVRELREKLAECQPVHAHWIDEGEDTNDPGSGNHQYRCTNCKHGDIHREDITVPFCWFCGAVMDEEV